MVHERAQRLRDATVPERHLVEVHGHERRVLGRRVLEPAGLLLPFPRRHLSGTNTGYASRVNNRAAADGSRSGRAVRPGDVPFYTRCSAGALRKRVKRQHGVHGDRYAALGFKSFPFTQAGLLRDCRYT